MIVSVYRKDENYYPKVLLEKHNFNDSYNADSDILIIFMKKLQQRKFQRRKLEWTNIKCLDLFLGEKKPTEI